MLDELTDPIGVHFLIPVDRKTEAYQVHCIYVYHDRIVYSPIDKVTAVKMDAIRGIMKNHFDIPLEARIVGIPEEDVAPSPRKTIYHTTAKPLQDNGIYDEWLTAQYETVDECNRVEEAMKKGSFSKIIIR